MATFLQNHRILVSRVFAALLIAVVLSTESLEEGTLTATVLFISGLVLIGIATVGRLWCSLYISGYKDNQLITVGPYSVSRNPLYFFSFLAFAGVGLATETFTLAVILPVFFAFVYPFVMRREERDLRARFGPTYDAYAARVPRFLPNPSIYAEPPTWVVDTRRFRRTMLDVVWFVWLAALLEFVEAIHALGIVKAWYGLY